jgi:hypothetical protein
MTVSLSRRIGFTLASTATVVAGAAAVSGSAFAAPAPVAGVARQAGVQPQGYVTVQGCTSLAGSVTLTPGLRTRAHAETAVVTGTLDGCSSYGQPQPGQGSFTAVVTGTASKTSGTLTGSFTASWPACPG